MIIIKELKDGFNNEMININSAPFVSQACISVENQPIYLIRADIKWALPRELKIAQRVPKSAFTYQTWFH